MAFTPSTLHLSVDTIAGGSLRFHFYETTDDEDTVIGTDYFTRGSARGLRRGDLIVVHETGTTSTYIATVSAISAAGHATVVIDRSNVIEEYETAAAVEAAHVNPVTDALRTQGYYAPGDGGGALYKRSASEPSHGAKLQSDDGAWWELAEVVPNAKQVGAKFDGTTDDTAAINILFAAGFKDVYLPAGTAMAGSLTATPTNGIKIRGAGIGKTILKLVSGGGHMLDCTGTSTKSNIAIEDLTVDCNNETVGTGIHAEYVSNYAIRRVEVKNTRYWGIFVGVYDGTDASVRNSNVVIEDCVFSHHTQTYEHILIFNTRDAVIRRCNFSDAPSGYGVGVFQNSDNIIVRDSVFEGCQAGCYYSVSNNNVYFVNNKYRSNTVGIQGMNGSDNGSFGYSFFVGLHVLQCDFYNNTLGLQLGAVQRSEVSGCLFDRNIANALVVDGGNNGTPVVPVQCYDFSITDCRFVNNNTGATAHALHPGILFQAIGGGMSAVIKGCSFVDTQGTHTQRHPITFTGGFEWFDVMIAECTLASYDGAESITLNNGAALSTNVCLVNCASVSDTLPSGVQVKRYIVGGVEEHYTVSDAVLRVRGGTGRTSQIQLGNDDNPDAFRILRNSTGTVSIYVEDNERLRFVAPAGATTTSLYVYDVDNANLEQVTVGAANSGGSGYKVLRIPN